MESMRRITTRRWWALLATTMVAMLASALPLTGTAHAATAAAIPVYANCSFASDQPSYRGWATIAFRGCPHPGSAQTADCASATAFRWTGSDWQAQYLNECSMGGRQVYVWPFAGAWSWVWTQQTGWLAIQSRSVLISRNDSYGLHTGH
jgi:hypothetical protein